MTRFVLALLSLVPALSAACSGDSERYENIQKLRALGVMSDKAVTSPSTAAAAQSVTLTFYAAVPQGEVITVESYQDTARSSSGTPVAVVIDNSSAVTEAHASFDLYRIKGTVAIPSADALQFKGLDTSATVQYGIKLRSKANGDQNIIGNVVVYPSGSPQLQSLAALPTVTITAPSKAAALNGTQDLRAEAATTAAETLRVGWFVNGGEIKNRNAAATTWNPKKTVGPITLVVTARGVKTGAFALDVIDFTAN